MKKSKHIAAKGKHPAKELFKGPLNIAFLVSAILGIIPFFHLIFVAILYNVIDPGPEKYLVMSPLPLYVIQPFALILAAFLGFALAVKSKSNKTILTILGILLLSAGAFLVAYYHSLNILFS